MCTYTVCVNEYSYADMYEYAVYSRLCVVCVCHVHYINKLKTFLTCSFCACAYVYCRCKERASSAYVNLKYMKGKYSTMCVVGERNSRPTHT